MKQGEFSAPGRGLDQGQDAVGDLGSEGNQGSRTDHALSGDDRVEHTLQVGVGAGDHAAEHVAGAGDGVRLEGMSMEYLPSCIIVMI